MRLDFEFVGTCGARFSADPHEFRGQSVREITADILEIIGSEYPGVHFFLDDVVEAANAIATAEEEASGAG